MTRKTIIATVFILVIVCGYIFYSESENQAVMQKEQEKAQSQPRPIIAISDFEIEVEIADAVEKQIQGLSDRPFMAENEGMLFVYEKPGKPSFWMKDMLFPLDFIYIKDDRVVDLVENVQPEGPDPIKRIAPKTYTLYVLEVNAGVVQRHNIKIGDSAVLK